ncbi:MAG: response regulator [Alphaproteobacteria bacterium]|mgnify:CR=1 FL=1|jgi:CheY-like chemotaxis protein|nr:response regulator [Alphaproteobacteria bacterium]MBT4017207.1 response regulator [Alphaproteobacteria bacterium]MBT4965298.1 response regulator [Alphaproteobacteria bacterium]MBT5160251.1 response regulator [Alphaproteobacteria bacterium]MBT5918198.1 response regulator [Alphaproteobacteria bacterium]
MTSILVIDDDNDFRMIVCAILEGEGYQVDEASEGGEGLDLYRASPTDVVLTDLIMPGQEGVETILELRKDFPKVRIIAMSGGGSAEPGSFLGFANKLGASDTLEKPFSRDLLLQTIEKVLN